MDTVSNPNGNGGPVPYSPATTELDDLRPADPGAEAYPRHINHIPLYSWWKKAESAATPFVVVEKETEWIDKQPFTVAVWILIAGDSNRYRKVAGEMLRAIKEGKIESITYR